jgi:hypothetical protein
LKHRNRISPPEWGWLAPLPVTLPLIICLAGAALAVVTWTGNGAQRAGSQSVTSTHHGAVHGGAAVEPSSSAEPAPAPPQPTPLPAPISGGGTLPPRIDSDPDSSDSGLDISPPASPVSLAGGRVALGRALALPGLKAPSMGHILGRLSVDRVPPAAPFVSGGSLAWVSVASVTISATGSSDALSGLAGYQSETSTDTGATWSPASDGSSLTVSAEGETMVRFRSVDNADNTSAWVSSTVRIDRALPSDPTVSGGSLTWTNAASVTVSAAGSSDTLSGVAGYESETSTDAGATWSPAGAGSSLTVSAEGETLVRIRALDSAGNTSAWVAGTVRIDGTPPVTPLVSGGSLQWLNVASLTISAAGSSDALSGTAGYESETSTDAGATWSPASAGSSLTVSAEGETMVRFRSVDNAGNTSAWATDTARIDRTVPSDPTVSGGSSTWSNAASVTVSAAGSTDAVSGIAGYESETSTDSGATWSPPAPGSSVTVSAEGQTLVRFRALDDVGNSSNWVSDTVRLDRTLPSAPTATTNSSATWKSVASVILTPTGASDTPSGIATYTFQASTDAGATWTAAGSSATLTITSEGETLVQSAAVDQAGNTSAWSPSATVRIDRTIPSDPAVSGGSLTWTNAASVTISATGSSDSGGSGLASYQSRTSTNGGTTWSTSTTGATRAITTAGQTLVQFRALDSAGNASAWAPASATPGSTVNIDRTLPTAPTVTGGSLTCATSRTITGSGSTDTGGAGFTGYEYRVSLDGGVTWGLIQAGGSITFSTTGTYRVQFHSLDGAINTSAWAPATVGAANTACIP